MGEVIDRLLRSTVSRLDSENADLKREIERLRAALREIVDAYTWWCEDQYDRDQRVVGDAIFEARKALEWKDG